MFTYFGKLVGVLFAGLFYNNLLKKMKMIERKNASSVLLANTIFFPFWGNCFLPSALCKLGGNYSADLILSR